jgi:hypothetical protein
MRKPAVIYHKAHMSLCGRPGAAAPVRGRRRGPRLPRTAAARAGCPAPGLAFAAVRPAFFAACIVEAAVAEAGGGPTTAGAGTARQAGREGRPRVGGGRAGTVGAPSRRLRRRGRGGSRPTGQGHPHRGQQNGQIEHFSQIATGFRKGMRRGAAITPRERADARDLLLTTLSSEPCVESSIFGFVMT